MPVICQQTIAKAITLGIHKLLNSLVITELSTCTRASIVITAALVFLYHASTPFNYLLIGQMRRWHTIFRFGRLEGPEAEAEFKQSAWPTR